MTGKPGVRRHEPFGTRKSIDGMDLPLTLTQKDLILWLPNHSDKAFRAYLGALCVYYGPDYPDRASHFAYGLRDVTDHLARASQETHEAGRGLTIERRRQLLLKTIDPTTNQSYGYDAEYDLLAESYSVLSKIAHPRKFGPGSELAGHLAGVENALHELIIPQIVINNVIDRIMSESPSEINAKRLIGLMTSGSTQIYIVKNLAPGWLHSMAGAGFFTNPKTKRHWMAHMYLSRCIDHDPEKVTEVILSYKPGMIRSDPGIFGEFLRCARKLSATNVARISRFILDENLHGLFVHYPTEYLDAAARLYLDGQHDLAISLARHGLSIDNINHGKYPGGDWLKMPVRRFVGALAGKDLLPIFGLLADLLERIIMDKAGKDGALHESSSSMHFMRPSIEDSDHNAPDDLGRSLVAHMRDCLSAIGRDDPGRLRAALDIIGKKDLLIYRRLEMFTYYTFPDLFREEMEHHAVQYMGRPAVYHEHYVMLKNNFSSMSELTKTKILAKIMEPESPAKDRDIWMLRGLGCIKDGLDGPRLDIYQNLVKKLGSDPHPGYLGQRGSSITSLYAPGPMEGKSPGEVFKIMEKYVPDTGHSEKTLYGFSYTVGEHPVESSMLAMRLADAHPRVQVEFFQRLGSAVSDKKDIDWNQVMSLMRHVAGGLGNTGGGLDREMIVSISHVLRDALVKIPLGMEFKDDLWEVIQALVRTGRGDQSDWAEFKKEMGSVTMSINSPDGLSFHVLILYAQWLRDTVGEKIPAPGILQILDKYADDPESHTASRHSVVGMYFHILHDLDRDWSMRLIPRLHKSLISKTAFWDGYAKGSSLYQNMFSDLYDLYGDILNRSSGDLRQSIMYKDTASHILLAHLYGLYDPKDIFKTFLGSLDEKKQSKDLIDHCVSQVGIIVKNIQENSGFDVDRLGKLWRHDVFSNQNLSGWFVGSKVDRKTRITQYLEYAEEYSGDFNLLDGTIDELKTLADEFPREVANCLYHMVGRPLIGYIPQEDIDDVLEILDKHDEVKDIVARIRERLAQRSG